MSSSFAERFNSAARPQLHRAHAETLLLEESGVTREIRGTFKRIEPEGGDADVGSQAYQGTAQAVIERTYLPDLPHRDAEFVRNGERWQVTHAEPQDEWTWILHLSRPNERREMPSRRR